MTPRRDHPRAIPNLHQLDAYLTGELSAQERAALDAWVASDPRHAETLEMLRRVGAPAHPVDTDDAWFAVAARTQGMAQTAQTSPSAITPANGGGGTHAHAREDARAMKPRSARVFRILPFVSRSRAYTIAGACCGVVLLALAWHWRGDIVRSTSPVPMSTYATANGQRAVITLADGSRVMLNVASRIEVPTNFSRSNRTVRLRGEAFFTVAHDASAPFTVIAGPSTTRVLGTSFVVRHYDTDTAATITVRDGKVAVQSVILTALQQVAVGRGGIGVIEPADTSRFSFASGVLTFIDTPLIDAIPALNRWYDVDLRLGDPTLATRKVVGGFKAGSPTDLMMMLGWTFNMRVVQDGRILTLYPTNK